MTTLQVMTSSVNTRFQTPEWILERVREVFGGKIDLDPATELSNPTKAGLIYTGHGLDGLKLAWHGNVFCNPPFGRQLPKWVKKALAECEAWNPDRLILLTPARVETKWWQPMFLRSQATCLLTGRVVFNDPDTGKPYVNKDPESKSFGKITPCAFPVSLTYFGPDDGRFEDAFGDVGLILDPPEYGP